VLGWGDRTQQKGVAKIGTWQQFELRGVVACCGAVLHPMQEGVPALCCPSTPACSLQRLPFPLGLV